MIHTEGVNNLVAVRFDVNEKRIMCTFKNQPTAIEKHCDANITYGENCNRELNVYRGMGTDDTVSTSQLESLPGIADYCYVVTAISNNVTVMVEGTLVNTGILITSYHN